ncbi:hypothetical protein LPB67_17645 [Undibacterium sp. Jales W-56]|uniref:hypothetical protein n=1 Tax=Undibacterium sp. Jales W-56 TaxID=2897325 RepID=UPI0021D1C953|nr:hypothetical protein [Undibacterium sp. Jales W-56]MCU6435606.1 hypothetical protein [Undibacterium sp. Jales W-56]
MKQASDELKTRARILLNALEKQTPAAMLRVQQLSKRARRPVPASYSLQLCLNLVAIEVGFRSWEHARIVLQGEAKSGDDMGQFWYDDKLCSVFMNAWFVEYEVARAFVQVRADRFLLPYGTQFVVVEPPYLSAIGVEIDTPRWRTAGHDLMASYGSIDWQVFVNQRLLATRGAFH